MVAKKFEEGAKGLGGLAGIAVGAYGIFDGVAAIRAVIRSLVALALPRALWVCLPVLHRPWKGPWA